MLTWTEIKLPAGRGRSIYQSDKVIKNTIWIACSTKETLVSICRGWGAYVYQRGLYLSLISTLLLAWARYSFNLSLEYRYQIESTPRFKSFWYSKPKSKILIYLRLDLNLLIWVYLGPRSRTYILSNFLDYLLRSYSITCSSFLFQTVLTLPPTL